MGDGNRIAGARVLADLASSNGLRTIALMLGVGALAAWTNAAQADVGLSKDGITDGWGYQTDDVSLTFYGVLDVGVGYLSHSYSASSLFASTVNPYNLNSSPHSFTGPYNGGISMNRVGVEGEKNFGPAANDLDVFFKVESAINPLYLNLSNNGQSIIDNIPGLTKANGASAIDGQIFSRAAYAGISRPYFGSLEFGRTTNFSLDQVVQYDPVQAALLFSPLGFSGGIGGGLGATENTRLDNSLKYENRIHTVDFAGQDLGNVDFGVQYKFATSTTDQEAESAYVAMLRYNYGPLSLMGTYSQTYNTVAYATQYSNVVAPDPNLQIENTSGFMISGKYQVNADGVLKVGFEDTQVTAPSNLGLTSIVKYYGMTLPDVAVNATGKQTFQTVWVGGDYRVLKNLDIGVAYYNVDTYNTPEVGKQYDANIFSFLADYTVMKGLDTYFGAMLESYSGVGLTKKAPVKAFSSNNMVGAGVRLKF